MSSDNLTAVSVIVTARNEAVGIVEALNSILENSYRDFELIVVNDASSDETRRLVAEINDARIRLLHNEAPLGRAASLNRALKVALGEIVFFTDADCRVSVDWIENGLSFFSDPGVVGVEGDIFYPVVPDSMLYKVPCNPFYHAFSRLISRHSRDYAGGNIAYRREVLLKLGGYDERSYRFAREDTDLAMRALKWGRIEHNSAMVVEHRVESWTWRSMLASARRYEKDVLFFRDYGFFFFSWHRILHPRLFFFPAVIWRYRRSFWRDYKILPAFICYCCLVRVYIWRGAFRYRALTF